VARPPINGNVALRREAVFGLIVFRARASCSLVSTRRKEINAKTLRRKGAEKSFANPKKGFHR
jgi:hypothetical protein